VYAIRVVKEIAKAGCKNKLKQQLLCKIWGKD